MCHVYYERAKQRALNNQHAYHLAAILKRNNDYVAIGINNNKHHRSFTRYFRDGNTAFCSHAEMEALLKAQQGDVLYVMRWRKNGHLAMAKPCKHCQIRAQKIGIRKIWYTDDDGNWQSLKP